MNSIYGSGRKNRKGLFGWRRVHRILPSEKPMYRNFLLNFERNSRKKGVNL